MKELFAYKFKSTMIIEDMFEHLKTLGPWTWHERDSDRWGFYMSAAPVADADRAIVKILIDPDDLDWFAVNVHFRSEKPAAATQFQELRHVLFSRVLPAIGATELTETDDYE